MEGVSLIFILLEVDSSIFSFARKKPDISVGLFSLKLLSWFLATSLKTASFSKVGLSLPPLGSTVMWQKHLKGYSGFHLLKAKFLNGIHKYLPHLGLQCPKVDKPIVFLKRTLSFFIRL